jgi:cysteinyl-tRNA synthetase
MDDDFNSPRAIAQVYELARLINAARDAQAPAESVAYAQGILHELTGVLGLTLKGRAAPSEVEPFIALLVLTRNELRAAKQFALADQIRNRLAGLGVVLEDSADGTAWKYTG